MRKKIQNQNRYLHFCLSDRFSNVMPNELYKLLNNLSRQSITSEFTINKYINESQEFINLFFQTTKFSQRKGLYLIDAPQGSGKTSFFMSYVATGINSVMEPTIIVEPKKSNINQLKCHYPFLAVLTGESQLINGVKQYPVTKNTPVVVCTPELAFKATYLLKKLFGYVSNIILDEAHDLITSIPTYRDADKFYQMLTMIITEQKTNIICVTATPEPINFIHFDHIFKFHAVQKLETGLFEIVDITNEDIKHISSAACYAAAIKEQLIINKMPMLILIENKFMIEKLTDILEEEGYQCLSVHSGNAENNPIMKSIVSHQMLPSYYNDKPIDVIFATSTIISGITINQNPNLGQAQFITAAIIEDMYKTDLSALSQFFCRLRYNTPKTVLFKKTFKSTPKKVLTLQECYDTIRYQSRMLNETSLLTNENYAGYNIETVSNINAIYDCDTRTYDSFAIYCNALAERDARLYGHNEEFLQELLKTYTYKNTNCVSRAYSTRAQLGLACNSQEKEEIKEIKMTRKAEKTEIAKKALETGSIIEKVFSNQKKKNITEEERNFVCAMKPEMKSLNLAYQIGGAEKVKEVVKKMADGEMSQKVVCKAEFEIFRDAALSTCGKKTLLELTKMDEQSVMKSLKKFNFDVPRIMKILKMLKSSKYYKHLDGFDLTMSLTDTVILLIKSDTEYSFLENIRKYNAETIINTYVDKKKTEKEIMKDSVMGQEIMTLLNLVLNERKEIRYIPGSKLGFQEFKTMAQYLDENVPVYAAFNQEATSIEQVSVMISDILNGKTLDDGTFLYLGGFRYKNRI